MTDARHLNALVDDDAPTLLRRSEPDGPANHGGVPSGAAEEYQGYVPAPLDRAAGAATSSNPDLERDLVARLHLGDGGAAGADPWGAPTPEPAHVVIGDPWSNLRGDASPPTTRSGLSPTAESLARGVPWNGIQVSPVIDILSVEGDAGDAAADAADDAEGDAPTRPISPAELRRAKLPESEEVVYASAPLLDASPTSRPRPAGACDDDAPTLIRKAPVSEDAPTRLRRAPVSRRTGPISTKEADKVHIHPKFDPRRLPTMRTLRPAKPPPKQRKQGIPINGTIPMARPQSPAVVGAPGGIDLAWVVAFLAAGGVTVVVAAMVALVR